MVFVRHVGSVAVVMIAAAVSVGGCADSSSTPSSTPSSTTSAAAVSTPPSASTVTVNEAATVPPGAPNPNAPEQVTPGDIPDNQVFVPYAPPGAVFEVSVPQGWARTADAAATVFTDKFNAVRIDARPRPVAPDVASVFDPPPSAPAVPWGYLALTLALTAAALLARPPALAGSRDARPWTSSAGPDGRVCGPVRGSTAAVHGAAPREQPLSSHGRARMVTSGTVKRTPPLCPA